MDASLDTNNLEERITEEKLLDCFCNICDLSGMTMDYSSKLKAFIRRFWSDSYRENEKECMFKISRGNPAFPIYLTTFPA